MVKMQNFFYINTVNFIVHAKAEDTYRNIAEDFNF